MTKEILEIHAILKKLQNADTKAERTELCIGAGERLQKIDSRLTDIACVIGRATTEISKLIYDN